MCSITKGKYTFVLIFNHIIDFFFYFKWKYSSHKQNEKNCMIIQHKFEKVK